jgi:hypothetical protein
MPPEMSARCSQAGCTYDTDGKCLEGVPNTEECPHLVRQTLLRTEEPAAGLQTETTDTDEVETKDWLALPGGEELDTASAGLVAASGPTRLIVVAGEPESGKTTLITSIYEKFNEGDFGGRHFAGSQTLIAFERICHPSRVSSDAPKPDTERTKGLNPRFFHLALRENSLNEESATNHLLITDLSGEAYKRAADNSDDAKKLEFLKRADIFVLLLDGERVLSKIERQEVLRRGLLILRSLRESEMLSASTDVYVALSKTDLIPDSKTDKNTADFVAFLKTEFQRFATDNLRRFEFLEVASRPNPHSKLPYAYNVDVLFKGFLAEHGARHVPRVPLTAKPSSNARECELFMFRQGGDQ